MGYRLEFVPSALRELDKVPPDARRRLVRAIERLANDPRPPGARALRESRSGLRLRVGDYWVLYQVDVEQSMITIGRVAQRGRAYR
jgi:mRNA interferase RelE/StbE